MQAAKLLIVLIAALAACAHAGYDWEAVLNKQKPQHGDATYYGQQSNQDEAGTCSFGRNFANSMKLPWTTGVKHSVALNDNMFSDSLPCGTCLMYRGTGQGIGTTPIPTSNWTMAIVNNRCPECSFGDIDLNLNGDGRWKVEWYAVPCNVGDSKLKYSIVVSTYYWFSLVVSNTRIPVAQVEVKINDVWVKMQRANNNQWPYYNTNGPWQTNFPMPIRVTSIAGETVEDVITSPSGGDGKVQFSADRVVHPEFQAATAAGGWASASGSGSAGSASYAAGNGKPVATASGQVYGSGDSGSSQGGSAPAPAPSAPAPLSGGAGQGQGSGSGSDNKPVASASVGQSSGISKQPSNEAYTAVGGQRLLRA